VRIWDVSPGYLSRQRLLGEHRELHAIYAIVSERKTGYARHPETLRWRDSLGGLVARHAQLVAEMQLRGYMDRTPLQWRRLTSWPATFVTPPHEQFVLLRAKYDFVDSGRIPLPRSPQQLWAQHKYSVLARSPDLYRDFGRVVSTMAARASLRELAHALTLALRLPPSSGRLVNALEHMWGYVAGRASADERRRARAGPAALLGVTQALAVRIEEPYLIASTALGELGAYVAALPPE
jgi:hypothetical protein